MILQLLRIMSEKSEFVALNLAVLTVSDSRTEDDDVSGKTLCKLLGDAGHQCIDKRIVKDDIYQLRATISAWIADPEVDAIVTTGGTGITGRDSTPEAVRPLLDKELEGFGELFRQISFQEIGSSTMQSRAMFGVANGTFIFVLPGSSGACRTAWGNIIEPQLDARTKPCNLVMLMPRLHER